MSRSHILMLAPAFPWPLDTGGKVRIAELYRGLRRHYRVTLLAPWTGRGSAPIPDDGVVAVRTTRPSRLSLCIRMLFSHDPYHAQLYRSRSMAERVNRYLRENGTDLVYAHFLYSAQYVPKESAAPVCLDPHNIDSQYWGSKVSASRGLYRVLAAANHVRVCAYERSLLPRFSAYVCVSEEDRVQTRHYACPPVKHVLTAPNGADLQAFVPSPRPRKKGAVLTLGFLGSLDIGMNVQSVRRFYKQVWPLLRARLPACPNLLLIGRNPAPSLRRLVNGDPAVTFSGTVADVRPWLDRTDIFIAPLIEGAGTKLKTLEAMAMGLPVVGSPIAFLGLGGEDGRHYRSAANDEAFVEAVVELAASPELRRQLGRAARKHVEDQFGWDRITDSLAADLATCFHLRME